MPNQGSTIGFRDYTLMLLLYSTAVRINELLTLKISNIVIDCVKPHIIVIGKGRKKRPIPLLAKPAQCLKRYLIKYHPKQNDANALLFCSKSKGIYVPMSAENVNKMLKNMPQWLMKGAKMFLWIYMPINLGMPKLHTGLKTG